MVVLPAPDSPTSAWISPGTIVSDASSTATKAPPSASGILDTQVVDVEDGEWAVALIAAPAAWG